MSSTITKRLVIDALLTAVDKRKPAKDLLFHSDQGSQYTSKNYQFLLNTKNIISSMNHTGCCYDNSVVESFFSSLKRELLIDTSQHSAQQTRTVIFEYIEIFITNSVDILLLIIAFLRNLIHHFHNKNGLTSSLLFLGKVKQVRPRSGLAVKFGITVLNAPGTIDADYRGEIMVPLINLGDIPYVVNYGDRIAQLII